MSQMSWSKNANRLSASGSGELYKVRLIAFTSQIVLLSTCAPLLVVGTDSLNLELASSSVGGQEAVSRNVAGTSRDW